MSASLLLSPGGKADLMSLVLVTILTLFSSLFQPLSRTHAGNKFYLFLLRFSSYVLRTICLEEAKTVGEGPPIISDTPSILMFLVYLVLLEY